MRNGAKGSTILFLQGPPSVFWTELADRCERAGARTLRVNLTAGDQVYWRKPGATTYRGSFKRWGAWLRAFMIEHAVTDVLYYADRLPYHVVARGVADDLGVACHAVENGYLRPDWLTVEPGGMGRYSSFPRDPDEILARAASLPEVDTTVRFRHSFGQEAFNEVTWNLLNWAGRVVFPLYRSDRYYNTVVDYLSWLPKAWRTPALRKRAADVEANEAYGPFWLVAMQLQSDYMIRDNAGFGHLRDMLDQVFASFARNAPAGSRLLVKLHPLDNGMENWGGVAPKIAARHGIADRIDVIEGGVLTKLLARAEGTIVVNSTVGLFSLRAGCPTIALGDAIYKIPGLTHHRGLDSFWQDPDRPDPALLQALVKLLAATTQVRGDFYDPAGRHAAAEAIVEKLAIVAHAASGARLVVTAPIGAELTDPSWT